MRDDNASYLKYIFDPGNVRLITKDREIEGQDRRALRPEKYQELRNHEKGRIRGASKEFYVSGTYLDRDPTKLIKLIEDATKDREKRLGILKALHELQLLQGVPKEKLYRPPQHVIDELNLTEK
ncbi:MAG TPA: hypothetical protein VFF13_00310 [archaeon]|nr:hypothetical protein [archaeon]